jgi:hypothetical protein
LSRSSPMCSGRPPSLARFLRRKELGMLGRQLHGSRTKQPGLMLSSGFVSIMFSDRRF